jgi:hypothetical protein
MEMQIFQRTWHGIDLTALPAAAQARAKPAGPEFYAQFYEALASGRGKIDPAWLENKRRLGQAIERDLIVPWQKKNGRAPKILALAAGRAPVERVWCERGHEVTFNDCQEHSLAELRREFPAARFLVGDVNKLKPDSKYDLITAITLEYVMNRRELAGFLSCAESWLQSGAQFILYSASILSFRQMVVETLKHLLGRYRREPHVFWGYWRTPGELSAIACQAGLRVTGVFRLTRGAAGELRLTARSGTFARFPPLRDPNLVVTLEPK